MSDNKLDQLNDNFEKGVKRTKGFLLKLVFGFFVVGVLGVALYMLYANYTFSKGSRSGVLVKVSKKGLLFKTYEGQLKMGGIDLEGSSENLSDTWSFSIKDEDVVKKLEELQGEKLILRYKEINQAMPWQGDTNYFVYDLEVKE